MRSCSAAISSTICVRCAAGRSGLRPSASRLARSPVSGVRSSWPASAAKRRVAASARSVASDDARRRASIALSACASERTSSGPSSSGRRWSRSRAPLTREAPVRRRSSGRTATDVKAQATRPQRASASSPISTTSRRVRPTRSSTAARLVSSCRRAWPEPSETVSARQSRPPIDTVRRPSRSGSAGGRGGDVAAALDDPVADRQLDERAAAREQRLALAARQPAGRSEAVGRAHKARGAVAQVAVDLVAAVALDRGQQQRARHDAPQRQRGQRRQRDPRAQAPGRPHDRRTQPTPRTVRSTRGSPAASSLRRR